MKKLIVLSLLLGACATSSQSTFRYELEPISKAPEESSRYELKIEFNPNSDLATLTNNSDKGVEVRLDSLTAIFDSWAFNVLRPDSRPGVEVSEVSSVSTTRDYNFGNYWNQDWGLGSYSSSYSIKVRNPDVLFLPAGSKTQLPCRDLLLNYYNSAINSIRASLKAIEDRYECVNKGSLDKSSPCYLQTREQLKRFVSLFQSMFDGKQMSFEVLFRQLNQSTWLPSKMSYRVRNPKVVTRTYMDNQLYSTNKFEVTPDTGVLDMNEHQEAVFKEITKELQ